MNGDTQVMNCQHKYVIVNTKSTQIRRREDRSLSLNIRTNTWRQTRMREMQGRHIHACKLERGFAMSNNKDHEQPTVEQAEAL